MPLTIKHFTQGTLILLRWFHECEIGKRRLKRKKKMSTISAAIEDIIAGVLVVWTSMCLLMGIIGVFCAKDTMNYNFMFMYLLTGVLSGILVIIIYVQRR